MKAPVVVVPVLFTVFSKLRHTLFVKHYADELGY